MAQPKALTHKMAIVTGASAGIGWAVAESLAAQGAHVVVSARRQERLEALVAKIKASGGQALAVHADAGKTEEIDRLVRRAGEWSTELGQGGRLDIVVANAGRGLAGGLLSSDRSQWEQIYQLNVIGVGHLMRRAAEIMVEQKSGDIVALGSVAGHHISPFSGFYGSSKFAVAAMAEGLRREICAHKVRVTTIKPAIVKSEFQEVAGYTEENFGKNVKRFGTLLDPDDVARAITFIVTQPGHVHINELMIRPVGQDYP